MTIAGTKQNRTTQECRNGKVDEHKFREKGLCSSANYHADLIDAMREYAALPHYTSAQVNDRAIRSVYDHLHIRGFFYEPEEQKVVSGSCNQQQGGANAFMHHHRRFRRGAWDAGKLDHQEET